MLADRIKKHVCHIKLGHKSPVVSYKTNHVLFLFFFFFFFFLALTCQQKTFVDYENRARRKEAY